MTKEEREEIFEDIILGLRKKFIHSDKEQLDAQSLIKDRLAKKHQRLPLD